jgi:hypothetical protein
MIVKIRCEEKWIFYDGFEKVSYEYLGTKIPHPDTDASWYGQKSNSDVDILIIGRKGNEETSIGANQCVYLCNDEGKTIEKLN